MPDHEAHEHAVRFLFHPLLVHFPIAFYFLELILILFWIFRHDDAYKRFALFSFRFGYLAMLAALAAGWRDAGGWQNITGEVREHFLGAVSVFVFYTCRAFYWKLAKPEWPMDKWLQLAQVAIGYGLVVWTALHGGELVYG